MKDFKATAVMLRQDAASYAAYERMDLKALAFAKSNGEAYEVLGRLESRALSWSQRYWSLRNTVARSAIEASERGVRARKAKKRSHE